jgi:hypothetical protein
VRPGGNDGLDGKAVGDCFLMKRHIHEASGEYGDERGGWLPPRSPMCPAFTAGSLPAEALPADRDDQILRLLTEMSEDCPAPLASTSTSAASIAGRRLAAYAGGDGPEQACGTLGNV